MPLYDYLCARCGKSFEELRSNEETSTPPCPTCAKSDEVTRVPFAKVKLGKKEDLRPPFIKGTKPPRR